MLQIAFSKLFMDIGDVERKGSYDRRFAVVSYHAKTPGLFGSFD